MQRFRREPGKGGVGLQHVVQGFTLHAVLVAEGLCRAYQIKAVGTGHGQPFTVRGFDEAAHGGRHPRVIELKMPALALNAPGVGQHGRTVHDHIDPGHAGGERQPVQKAPSTAASTAA